MTDKKKPKAPIKEDKKALEAFRAEIEKRRERRAKSAGLLRE